MLATLPLAALAGLLSFASPCVFPLVPSYLAYVGGNAGAARGLLIRNALLFILGFSLAFIALGASASALGTLLLRYRYELIIVAGAVIIIFGLNMIGLIRIPLLMRQASFRTTDRAGTPGGAVALGFAFAVGWTPCIGPMLAGILTLASVSDTLGEGVLLLTVYAMGLGIPFLLAALAVDRFKSLSAGLKKHLPLIEKIGGSLLIVMGVLMVTGYYTIFNGLLLGLTPDWLFSRL